MPGTTASTPKKLAPAKQDKATDGALEPPATKSHATDKSRGAEKAAAEKTHGRDKTHAAKTPAEEKSPAQDKAPGDGKAHADEKTHAEKAPARASTRHDAPAARKSTEGYANDHKFLDSQRKALEAERSTYVEQAQSLRAEADSLVEEMEPGDIQFDEESGEGGTVTVDRERDLALSAQALVAVEEIDHAMAKIDLGIHGICEGCGTLIPKNRLEALPYARLCIACKSGGLSRR